MEVIEFFPLNTPLVINGYYPMLIMVTKQSFTEHHTVDKRKPKIPIKKKIRKFYDRRHFLFKQFDRGIRLDEESWYSVVPEDMGKYITDRLMRNNAATTIIDGFCGSGGLAIQLARGFEMICIDLDPVKLDNLQHNMGVYRMQCRTVHSDFLLYEHEFDSNLILSLCPPWGGVQYHRKLYYDLNIDMQPSLKDVLCKAFTITHNLFLQLPRNVNIKQLICIFQEATEHINCDHFALEIEMLYLNNQLNQLIVYFGDVAAIKNERVLLNLNPDASIKEACQQLTIADQFTFSSEDFEAFEYNLQQQQHIQ